MNKHILWVIIGCLIPLLLILLLPLLGIKGNYSYLTFIIAILSFIDEQASWAART